MRERIKPFDLNLISTYMGRWLTLVITAFIIAVAVGAYVGRGGGAQRNIIDVCVDGGSEERAADAYEPLRALLSDQTRRPVRLSIGEGSWNPGCDLYIMPTDVYLRRSRELGVVAFYEIKDTERQNDSALLVSSASAGSIDFAALSPNDVAFWAPRSVNGFWVQISMLERKGFRVPPSVAELRFEGTADDVSRALLGVVYGTYRLAACRMSDLTSLVDHGVIRQGELALVERADALPQVVVAGSPSQVAYYRRKLAAIDRLLEDIAVPASRKETVRLLKSNRIRSLDPIENGRIEEARRLWEGNVARLGSVSQ
jgi:hypothetical protein